MAQRLEWLLTAALLVFPLSVEDIQDALRRRMPGRSSVVSPRKEPDEVAILSGVFEGVTTGTPIALQIQNRDADSSSYESLREIARPGHANAAYIAKYGIFDWRGSGRASARETAARVAAGAVATKLLAHFGIGIVAYLKVVGTEEASISDISIESLTAATRASDIFAPAHEEPMRALIERVRDAGDSVGGVVELRTTNLPQGLGDPIYEKLEARLAYAMMSLPASKAFEIGEGVHASSMQGSMHNDGYALDDAGRLVPSTNRAGGTLGGISTGAPLLLRVHFKPASTIRLSQATTTLSGAPAKMELPANSRQDPCVAIRAVPVVEAMAALVLIDALLMQRLARL